MIQSSLYHLYTHSTPSHELLLCADSKQLREASDFYHFYNALLRAQGKPPIAVFTLPEMRASFGDDLSSFREEFVELLCVLRDFYAASAPRILLAPVSSVLYPLPRPEILRSFYIKRGEVRAGFYENLKAQILRYGYECVDVIELEGEVSFRGDIIDIFMPNAGRAHRIVFFDDEVESIRCFDTRTQLSDKVELEGLEIIPALFALSDSKEAQLRERVDGGEFEGLERSLGSFGLWVLGDEEAAWVSEGVGTIATNEAIKEVEEIYSLGNLEFTSGHSALSDKSAIDKARGVDEPLVLSPCSPCQSPDFSSQILECQGESLPKDSKKVSESTLSESHSTSESTLSDSHSISESAPPVIASAAKQSIKQDSEKIDCHEATASRNDAKTESTPHTNLESKVDSEVLAERHALSAIESHSGDKQGLSPTLKASSGWGIVKGEGATSQFKPLPLNKKENIESEEVKKTLEVKAKDFEKLDLESKKAISADSQIVDCHDFASAKPRNDKNSESLVCRANKPARNDNKTQSPPLQNLQSPIDSSTPPHALPLRLLRAYPTLQSYAGFEDILFSPAALPSMLKAHAARATTLLLPNAVRAKELRSSHPELAWERIRILESGAVLNILTPHELILSLNTHSRKPPTSRKKSTLKLNEIAQGEYVVHSDYGVGIFEGIKQAQVAGVVRDFIQIAYQGEDKLLLPVENLNMIERYVADSGQIPLLDRLGKGSFARLKQKVRAKLLEIANGIIELAAKRNLLQGLKIDTHKPELAHFKASCGFELTIDQERSIGEIFSDLSSGRVMDRLLSGDVGFGKTEVAMNAIYAACLGGYQAAMIVPTTLLSSQHFHTLQARLEGYGIRVARCDRFIKPKEKAALFHALESGSIQVVVGTHALLGAKFKNLALIVVDEEHKFGVKQKEQIKALSTDTHLLSMSATPIPRTLNMALSQIKGLSSLQTPPQERLPVRTFLKIGKDSLLKEVILRELRRGGQVFYIHNNIASIERKRKDLESLLPQLKIATLHSQVDNAKSEEIMLDFARGGYNLLLCTSIVESGIHLPNANTIIVAGADRFGIADLHQLRGRVGRGSREGFCYFLVEDLDSLTDEAKKRLSALEKNSYLGSGENLAYYDLEIRGGGNLLGEAQSGHIKNIGYGLYLRMLEECINYLSGKGSVASTQCDLKLNINAYLSPELIASDKLRLELYRRLSLCEESDEVSDIESEIFDRFGKLDSVSEAFIELIRIKVLANKLGLKQILHYGQNLTLIHADESKQSLRAESKDWDSVLECLMGHLRARLKERERALESQGLDSKKALDSGALESSTPSAATQAQKAGV